MSDTFQGRGTGNARNRAKGSPRKPTIELEKLNSSPTLQTSPTWAGGPALLQQNVALLEIANEALVQEMLAGTPLAEVVVRRLTPTLFIVDHERLDELIKVLTKRGYEPKLLQ